MVSRSTLSLPALPRPSNVVLAAIGTATGRMADAYGLVTGVVAGAGRLASAVLPPGGTPAIGTNPQRRYASAVSRRLAP